MFGRGEKTRTSGLYVPNVARYQLRYTPPFLRLQKYIFFDNSPLVYFFLKKSHSYRYFFYFCDWFQIYIWVIIVLIISNIK